MTVISSVPLQRLRQFEADLCRARHRAKWWAGVSNDVGAVGKMIEAFLSMRRTASQDADGEGLADCTRLTQARLLEAVRDRDRALTSSTLTQFLNGQANTGGGRDWYKLAPIVLRLVLEGAKCPRTRTVEEREVVDRICGFFFPPGFEPDGDLADRNRAWFFHPRLQRITMPATRAEAAAELRAIAYHSGPQVQATGRGVVVRISGATAFMQVDSAGELTELGHAALDCLSAGVDVFFAYPRVSPPTEAEHSAKVFQAYAAEFLGTASDALHRLHLLAIEPGLVLTTAGRTVWSGEYLSRSLRFSYQRCLPVSQNSEWEGWSTLLASRDEKYGLCAYQTDETELKLFLQWLRAFIPQAAPAHSPVPASSALHPKPVLNPS